MYLDEMSDGQLLAQMVSTFPVLDEWQSTLRGTFSPDPGSELAQDDLDWFPNSLSHVAVIGLTSAQDHLNAVRVLIEARQLFQLAHPSLIRAALIGAAQAVWVLHSGDRSERLRRARTVAWDEIRNHVVFVEGVAALPRDHQTSRTADVLDHLRERKTELSAKRLADGDKGNGSTTEMIREAAAATFDDPALAAQTVLIWQSTSGAAHGYSWQLLGTHDTAFTDDMDCNGMISMSAGGGVRRIANEYTCAFMLAEHAWRLLRRRAALNNQPRPT